MKNIQITTFIFITVIFVSCTNLDNYGNLHYIEIDSADFAMNYNTQFINFYTSDSPYAAPMVPVYNGDWIQINNNCLYHFDKKYDIRMKYAFKDSIDYINDKINTISILSGSDIKIKNEQINDSFLKDLQALYIEQHEDDSLPKTYLSNIATVRSNVGLNLIYENFNDRAIENLKWLLNRFDPAFLSMPASDSTISFLEKKNQIEFLIINYGIKKVSTPLPQLPNLKNLVLNSSESGYDLLPSNFLIHNPQIESLTISINHTDELKLLQPLLSLKSLHIFLSNNLQDLNQLVHHKNLHRLLIDEKNVRDLSVIKNLKHLKWLRLPDSLNQKELEEIFQNKPELDVLEINATSLIRDLSFLKENLNLKALTIFSKDSIKLYGLEQLKQLEFLSLPKNNLKDSLLYIQLKKSLPNTKLVPNTGICLSSIWILLIIPFVSMIYFFRNMKSTLKAND